MLKTVTFEFNGVIETTKDVVEVKNAGGVYTYFNVAPERLNDAANKLQALVNDMRAVATALH